MPELDEILDPEAIIKRSKEAIVKKGKMIVEEDSDGQLWICPEDATNLVCEICQAEDESGNIITTDEDRENAQLIAEAFNVANATGKSPQELADENKELSSLLQRASELIKSNLVKNNPDPTIKHLFQVEVDQYNKAIKKAIHKS